MAPSPCDTRQSNDEGSILLIVLMLLLLVTIIGMSAIDNSVSEMRIARYDRLAKRNFYNAEAGLYDAVADFERIYTNSTDTGGNRLYPLSDTLPLYVTGTWTRQESPLSPPCRQTAFPWRGSKSAASFSKPTKKAPD